MKRLFLFLSLLVSSIASAQFTTTTATVQFPGGQAFANGTVSAAFLPLNGNISVQTYKLNGLPFPYIVATTLNGSGFFTMSLADDHVVSPQGGLWKFTVCSAANIPCTISVQDVFGPSIDLSSAINSAITIASGNSFNYPRFYNDSEAAGNLASGTAYYNLTTGTLRYYNGTTWQDVGGTSSPLTTKGDIYVFGTTNTRLPVGADGTCLTANSAQILGLQWGTCGSGSLPTAPIGQILVSQGTGVTPILRQAPFWDVRDYMTCNTPIGTATGNNVTAGLHQLLTAIGTSPARVYVRGATNPSDTCLVSSFKVPPNVTFDYSYGGAFTLLVDHTAPGGGSVVDHSGDGSVPGQSNPSASPSATCTMTLNGTTAGNTIWVAVGPYNTFGSTRIASVTDSQGNFFLQKQTTTLGQASFVAGYIAGSIVGGNDTITVNLSGTVAKNACMSLELAGLGPSPSNDGQGSFAYGSTTPFNPGTATFLANDFVIIYSEDPNDAQTCTAGAGYTQPPGLAGNVSGTNGTSICQEYNTNGAGGATTGTQNFSSSPVLSSWGSAIIGLRPGSATVNYCGSIDDPDLHQIFYQATGTNGVVDFTCNLALKEIDPEWWGASPTNNAATNTPAIQASEYAAFGCGTTTCRINGSGLSIYNKQWNLNGSYQINAEIQLYHLIGSNGARWKINCNNNGGLVQTASNLRIFDGQSDAYGRMDNCEFAGAASSTGSLIDWGYSGAQGNDLRPQFLDFYGMTIGGGGQVAIGMIGAKEGGGAQYSNVYCYDCAFSGFTQACYQIGTPTLLAQNALSIGYTGDMQSCPGGGLVDYGGGWVSFGGSDSPSSMENGYATQTGYDMDCEVTQGPCILKHYRSESRKMIAALNLVLEDDVLIDQASFPPPGISFPVGSIMRGGQIAGDGAHYKVTVDSGPFIGAGTPAAPIRASGGSSTTLVDTNETINGSNTIKTIIAGDALTQGTTGATGTVVIPPGATIATITGSVGTPTCTFNETITQSVTGITATEQAPSPPAGSNSPLFANNFSGTADNTHSWIGASSGCVYTPTAAPAFPATTIIITAHTGSPDNSHAWTNVSGGTFIPTTVPTGVNWTVNAFVGMQVANYNSGSSPTNRYCYGTITANSANTITVAAGWTTKSTQISCPGPDSTTLFALEPLWNHGTIVDGGITMVYMNEDVIGTCQGCVGFVGTINNVSAPGGQIHVWPNGQQGSSSIKGLTVTRQDWLSTGTVSGAINDLDWDIRVTPSGGDQPINWSFPTVGSAGAQYFGPLHHMVGSKVFEWLAGSINTAGGTWIGGRSDANAGNIASRNILEYGGMFGRAAPVPAASNSFNLTNVAGTDTDITGGPSTGTALGGAINWWISQTSGSGVTVNSGFKAGRVNSTGQIESLLSTGTAPFKATSTTPVTNLTTVPTTYNLSGTQQINVHIVEDTGTLSSGTPSIATITLTGSAGFTSNSTYKCGVSNNTTQANSLSVSYTSGSVFVVTGPNTVTDSFSFICVGN